MTKERSRIDRKATFFLGLVVGIALYFGILQAMFYLNKNKITSSLIKFYELAFPGSKVDIVSLSRSHGMIKAFLKITQNGQIGYREVYVSKDGEILTEGVLYLKESTQRIQKFKDFVDCLYNKDARIYGLTNDSATILQLNLLGRYSTKIFIPCDNMMNQCINMGIKRFPTFVYNNTGYPGVLAPNYIANITGCESPL